MDHHEDGYTNGRVVDMLEQPEKAQEEDWEDNPEYNEKPPSNEDRTLKLEPMEHEHELTIDEAFDLVGFGWTQWMVLVICGLTFSADAIEVGLLSFLQEEVAEEFGITDAEKATLSSVVFAGELAGTIVLGPLADKFGRKPISIFSAVLITFAGLLSAFSPNYAFMVATRAIVGIGVGGLCVPFDILAEFLPTEKRGQFLLGIEFFWTFGSMFVTGLAWGASDLSWRYLVGLCAIPVSLGMVSFYWLPESPRWLMQVGRPKQALKILREAAARNGRRNVFCNETRLILHKTVPQDAWVTDDDEVQVEQLITGEEEAEEMGFKDLFNADFRATTIKLWIVWTSFGFAYYGIILTLSEVLPPPEGETFNYPGIFAASTSEVVGCTVAVLLMERVGRRYLSGIPYISSGILMCLLAVDMPTSAKIAVSMFARMFIFISSSVTWVQTPELYPTIIRASGHAWCNAVARIGAFATPYWGDASDISIGGRLSFYGALCVIAGISTFFLKETRGVSVS